MDVNTNLKMNTLFVFFHILIGNHAIEKYNQSEHRYAYLLMGKSF